MAKKRLATLSVADHLDLRSLVPDVLLFDRLAFPYPADQAEWRLWLEKQWDPYLLEDCLDKLGPLALPFDWGEEQHHQFRTNMEQAQHLVSEAAVAVRVDEPDTAQNWENAKQVTREMIAGKSREDLQDIWVMPSYRSRDAFLTDQQIKIGAPSRQSRRDGLIFLVGQEMLLPEDADPNVAFDLAVQLAKDESFKSSRRDLYNWQEDVIQREQSRQDDAQDLADLMSKFHAHVEKIGAKTRKRWLIFVLKGAAHALELANPASWANLFIEAAEFFGDRKPETPPGPTAVFQHISRQVIEPAKPRKPSWR